MLVPSGAMKKLLAERLRVYQEQFRENPEGLTYWENRGLTKATAEDFRVGYVAEPLKGDQRFKARLAIPYLTPAGVVGFKFRATNGSPERFSKDRGDPNRLFNTRILVRARKLVLCEGEIDTMAATQAGLQAVGIPGAKNWKPEWSRVFYNRQISVLADGDETGHEFAEVLGSKLYGVRIIDMPDGEDVTSMLQKKGEQWIRNVVLG